MALKFQYDPWPIAKTVEIGCETYSTSALPKGIRVIDDIGIAAADALDGSLLYRAPTVLYEVRSTITPGGDYLVMFPVGGHYNQTDRKINTMMALRSSDKGKTWSNPYVAFNIEYNQHGFIPLIPKGSKRIYSFGTQAVFGLFTREDGLFENAPIGYLYSDDDGFTWKGPTLINPVNDPGFTGMSVMRMCETNKGTWLLGTHEGYHDPQPCKSNLYMLRSEDQGESWELLPGRRTNGWHVMPFHRMDEGRPIQVGDRILFITRTPQGHLWALWSDDDGKTWTDPVPTPLVHPDAPPMITHLSDGKTLVCLHHNRFHDFEYTGLDANKVSIMGDRSEIWAAFSSDCGKTWSEPGFLYCNAVAYKEGWPPFFNNQCSYNDLYVDGNVVNIYVPHRWHQVLHLQIKEEDLLKLPKKNELM
ncbi:MAG: glycoside hydrolase [Defluviitaleaceae bacterium]|nr:glycoside hydrolase [Defluviitaleaceae bacterium]